MPPPHPMTGLEELSNQVRGINIRTGVLQTAFNSHVQVTTGWHKQDVQWQQQQANMNMQHTQWHQEEVQWRQQQQQQWTEMNERMKAQQDTQAAYWRHMGYFPLEP